MGKKIFVSYKYGDTDVYPLKGLYDEYFEPTKVRDYINEIQNLLSEDAHINKGEADGEPLCNFKDATIESKLRDKIYDSSITIVVISPKMKNLLELESEQWIPWEISYSLKEHTRNGRTSKANAVLAVVLPDKNNSYSYFIEEKDCCGSGCRLIKIGTLFKILTDNMFNLNIPNRYKCDSGKEVYSGESSYIYSVKWSDFKKNTNFYIEKALEINGDIEKYSIIKSVSL